MMTLIEYSNAVADRLQMTASTDLNRIQGWVNLAIQKLYEQMPEKLYKEAYLPNGNLIPSIITSVNVVNGSTTITGVFTTNMNGMKICVGQSVIDYKSYVLTVLTDGTTATLDSAYTEETANGNTAIIYQDEYNLPSDFRWPLAIMNGQWKMSRIPESDFSGGIPTPGRTTPCDPSLYRLMGWATSPYALSPTATLACDQAVNVVSTNASDIGTLTLYGNDGTYDVNEIITLNGTSLVHSVNHFMKLYYIKMLAPALGRINFAFNNPSVSIGYILPNDTELPLITRHRLMKVFPLPLNACPIFVKYYKQIPRLLNNSDYIKEFDDDYDSFIIDRAVIEGLWFIGDETRAAVLENRWTMQLMSKLDLEGYLGKFDQDLRFGFGNQSPTPQNRIPFDIYSGNPFDWGNWW